MYFFSGFILISFPAYFNIRHCIKKVSITAACHYRDESITFAVPLYFMHNRAHTHRHLYVLPDNGGYPCMPNGSSGFIRDSHFWEFHAGIFQLQARERVRDTHPAALHQPPALCKWSVWLLFSFIALWIVYYHKKNQIWMIKFSKFGWSYLYYQSFLSSSSSVYLSS